MFEAQVSTGGNTAVVVLDSPQAPMPFAVHLFGAEVIAKWNGGSDVQRILEANTIVTNLTALGIRFGLNDSDAASLYNRGCSLQGIEDHAIEYLGGGID